MAESLVWFDYETFGLDTVRDRPAQFASIRTDLSLNPIAESLTLYCQPPRDYLPNPESCVMTGISPLRAMALGLPENAFIRAIQTEFLVPKTCAVGYNNVRFDDEVTRNTLYRNLQDPFAREWQNGNSRWDLLGVLRMARALRPEGLVWPVDATGKPTLRLDHLTVANGIPHEDAHDALGDVRATLALAKLLKERQPRLFDYLWTLRLKRNVLALINASEMTPFLMASGRMSGAAGHLGIVVVVGRQPGNPNAMIVYDLRHAPDQWEALGQDEEAPNPFSLLHVNRAPALAPLSVLRPEDAERLGLDVALHQAHLSALMKAPYPEWPSYRAFMERLPGQSPDDVDLGLYGGFASDQDRLRLQAFANPEGGDFLQPPARFDDPRYLELCRRFKARNYPDRLSNQERSDWDAFCRAKWHDKAYAGVLSLEEFQERVAVLKGSGLDVHKMEVLEETDRYVRDLVAGTP